MPTPSPLIPAVSGTPSADPYPGGGLTLTFFALGQLAVYWTLVITLPAGPEYVSLRVGILLPQMLLQAVTAYFFAGGGRIARSAWAVAGLFAGLGLAVLLIVRGCGYLIKLSEDEKRGWQETGRPHCPVCPGCRKRLYAEELNGLPVFQVVILNANHRWSGPVVACPHCRKAVSLGILGGDVVAGSAPSIKPRGTTECTYVGCLRLRGGCTRAAWKNWEKVWANYQRAKRGG